MQEKRLRANGFEQWWDFQLTNPSMRTAFDVPANDQQAVYDAVCKIRAVLGGNRSSKSQTMVKLTTDLALGMHPTLSVLHPAPTKGYIIAPKWEDNIKAVILEKKKKFIPRCYLRGGSWDRAWSEGHRRLDYANGSFERFFTYTQDRDVLGGQDLDYAAMDEHGPYTHFLELMARLSDRNGMMILTYTPEEGMTWEREEIIEASEINPDRVKYWMFSIYGNPHLDKKGVEEFAATIKDPNMRRAKLYGEHVLLTGAVIPGFNEQRSIVPDFEIPAHWPRSLILDPHDRTPHAVLWMAWDEKDNCYVYRTMKRRATMPELVEAIRVASAGERIDCRICDEANDGDEKDNRGNKSIMEELRDEGMSFEPTGQKSEAAFKGGIHKLRHGFTCDAISRKPKIYIFESCNYGSGETIDGKPQGSIVWELQRYRYKKEQRADEETLRESIACVNDHLVTCLRYGYYVGSVGIETKSTGVTIVRSVNPNLNKPRTKKRMVL